MSDLVKRSDVIETAKKVTFTDEHEKRKFLDLLDYCLKETKTAYDVDAVVEQLEEETRCSGCSMNCIDVGICGFDEMREQAIEIVKAGGANDSNSANG